MNIKTLLTPLMAVAILLTSAFICGCGKESSDPQKGGSAAVRNRMDDSAYVQQLKDSKARQNKAQSVMAKTSERMRVYIERARKALPKGATDEQIERELETNPAKYPDWKVLKQEFRLAEARRDKELADLRRNVRRRVMADAAAQSAAQGTAGAKPAPKK